MAVSAAKFKSVTGFQGPVRAEVASSSLVVPATFLDCLSQCFAAPAMSPNVPFASIFPKTRSRTRAWCPLVKEHGVVMKVILFGATGMVGQGVLRECLRDDDVDTVLSVGRRSIGRVHSKLRELVRKDMFDFNVAGVDLQGYDACFFCLGVSSAGMSEADYTRSTFDLTLGWARALAAINPPLTFIYVSAPLTAPKALSAHVRARTTNAPLPLFT